MTIAFVGSCGHVGYAFDPIQTDPAFSRVALAPASKYDDMSSLYAICQKNGKNAVLYDDWRELLEKEKPSILVNCSVCSCMAEINIAALHHGVHVLSEKPLARTLPELDALETAWRESGRVLLAMLPFRYEPGFRAAAKAVREGVIGEVRLLNAQKSYKLGHRPAYYCDQTVYGGTILWVGAHAIDFVLFMSGEHIKSAAAYHSDRCNGGHGDLDVSAVCAFGMTGDVTATVTLDYFRPAGADGHGDDRVRVVGTDGILEVADGKALLTKNGSEILPDVTVPTLFEDFMSQVQGGKALLLSGEQSVENARACLGARTAAETGSVYQF